MVGGNFHRIVAHRVNIASDAAYFSVVAAACPPGLGNKLDVDQDGRPRDRVESTLTGVRANDRLHAVGMAQRLAARRPPLAPTGFCVSGRRWLGVAAASQVDHPHAHTSATSDGRRVSAVEVAWKSGAIRIPSAESQREQVAPSPSALIGFSAGRIPTPTIHRHRTPKK